MKQRGNRNPKLMLWFLSKPMKVIYVCLLLLLKIKNQTFKAIKNKVWAKLQRWKGFLFSLNENEILIKVVIQALSTYPLSIFKTFSGL